MKRKDDHQDKLNEIKEMIAKVKLEKMSILEQQVIIKICLFCFFFDISLLLLLSYVNVIMKI
jgi:hypothetical protein